MRKFLPIAAAMLICAAFTATAAMGAPKPPTTTAPTTTTAPPVTTQVMGVPHHVAQNLVPDFAENLAMCPAGEVAVSISYSRPGNPVIADTLYAVPVTADNQYQPGSTSAGYRVYVTSSDGRATAHLICAPLVTVEQA